MQFQFAVIESEGDFSFNISLLVCGDGVDSFGSDGVGSNNGIVQLSTINIRINDILSFVECPFGNVCIGVIADPCSS